MFAVLYVLKGVRADFGARAVVGPKGVVIGRSPDAELRLRDPSVSRVHCRVSVVNGKVFLADAGSVSGTTVNGSSVQERELASGDLIRVGTTEIQFQWSDADEKATESWQPPDQADDGGVGE